MTYGTSRILVIAAVCFWNCQTLEAQSSRGSSDSVLVTATSQPAGSNGATQSSASAVPIANARPVAVIDYRNTAATKKILQDLDDDHPNSNQTTQPNGRSR